MRELAGVYAATAGVRVQRTNKGNSRTVCGVEVVQPRVRGRQRAWCCAVRNVRMRVNGKPGSVVTVTAV